LKKAGKENIRLFELTTENPTKTKVNHQKIMTFKEIPSELNSFLVRPNNNRINGPLKINISAKKLVPPSKNGKKKIKIKTREEVNFFLRNFNVSLKCFLKIDILNTMPSEFYQKYGKRGLEIILSLLGLIVLSPLFLLIGLLIKLDSPGPVIFRQKRAGKNGRPFTLFKFRTMIRGAESLKKKYLSLNEADGPVFKIRHDPRLTKIGRKLSHTGLDELPQLLNILRGEMSLVGPRPLPLEEESKIPAPIKNQRKSVCPGLVSSWLLRGAHNLSFKTWMELDLEDIKKSGLAYDLSIFLKTIFMATRLVKNELKNKNHFPFSK